MSVSKIRSWSCICHVLASALACHVSQIRPCAPAAFLHMRGADNVICRFANDRSSHFGRLKLDTWMSLVYLFPCLSRHVKGKEKASEASSFNIVLASRCCIPVGTCPGRLITHNRDAIKPHVLSDDNLQRANHGVYAPAILLDHGQRDVNSFNVVFLSTSAICWWRKLVSN